MNADLYVGNRYVATASGSRFLDGLMVSRAMPMDELSLLTTGWRSTAVRAQASGVCYTQNLNYPQR